MAFEWVGEFGGGGLAEGVEVVALAEHRRHKALRKMVRQIWGDVGSGHGDVVGLALVESPELFGGVDLAQAPDDTGSLRWAWISDKIGKAQVGDYEGGNEQESGPEKEGE